jgi:hypothetical protein
VDEEAQVALISLCIYIKDEIIQGVFWKCISSIGINDIEFVVIVVNIIPQAFLNARSSLKNEEKKTKPPPDIDAPCRL